jgi:hypothetical protein
MESYRHARHAVRKGMFMTSTPAPAGYVHASAPEPSVLH